MSQLYDLEFNKSDVVLRNILIGVLATLNNKMYWYNRISQTEKKKINIPFYFSTTGDERFLMDTFMNNVSAGGTDKTKAEGVYNQIPRGIVQLDGVSIDAGSMTNKFVRAFYQRIQEDGTLRTKSSEVFMVPLKMPFTVDIHVNTNLDIFKAIQRAIQIFYKHQIFQVDIDGTRIPALASMPEDFSKERPIEYSFGDKKEWKVTFNIEVQTFLPIFKNAENGFLGPNDTEYDASNVMQGFGSNIRFADRGGISSISPFAADFGANDNAFGPNSENQSASGTEGFENDKGSNTGTFDNSVTNNVNGNGPNQSGNQVDPTNTDNRGGYGPTWPVRNPSPLPKNGGATSS